MPNLAQNPHEAPPPDFGLDCFLPAQQPLVNDFHISHEEAAQRLLAIWQAQNALDRQEWNVQLEADARATQQAREQQCHKDKEQQRLQMEEQESVLQEERKKNCNKFLLFADTQISTSTPVLPSPLALRKLRKGEYCELYFFTNKDLMDMQAYLPLVDDEALAITQDNQGLHSFVPVAAARAKQLVIEDKDLTWPQIDEAMHRILQAMKENGWDQKRLESHLGFWMALGAHEWRHDAEETSRKALIIYQATARRRWHDMLGTAHSFNLKYINEELLSKIRRELTHKAHNWAIKQANEVSPQNYRALSPQLSSFYSQKPSLIHHTLHHFTRPGFTPQCPWDRTHYTATLHVAPASITRHSIWLLRPLSLHFT